MNIASKIRTLYWFARRPPLWGQAVHLVARKFQPSRDTEAHRELATMWCQTNMISTEDLLAKLGISQALNVRVVAGEVEWLAAEQQAAECPYPMGGAGHLDLLYACAEGVSARRVLETGVAYGWSSYALLLSLSQREGAQLVSTDMPYVQHDLDDWVGCVVPERLRPYWTLIRLADRQGLPKAIRWLGQIDVCHYDSDKSYVGRLWAYPLLWDALRPGGLLISDDVQDNEGFRHFVDTINGATWGITEAFGKYIGVIRKPG